MAHVSLHGELLVQFNTANIILLILFTQCTHTYHIHDLKNLTFVLNSTGFFFPFTERKPRNLGKKVTYICVEKVII